MDARQRRWWQLLDSLPGRLGGITCWSDVGLPPAGADFGFHAVPTLVVCLAGVLRVSHPDARIDLGPGDALLLAAGVWHRHEPLRPGAVWFGQGFLPALSDVALGDRDAEWRGRLPLQPSRRLMDQAVAARDGATTRAVLGELIDQVLAESVDALDFGAPPVQRMVQALWHRLHLGVDVADLVRASGLSRSRAYELFARGYGVTPKVAIAATRLSLAASLLAAGLPVAEVARRCGYASADTFARCWRREHGKSPSRR
jgi:AraC-like DNA-binding protein